jgi:hypothetical protein
MKRLALLLSLLVPLSASAGLYYSEETFAELPSRWRGYLLDQRVLRQVAARPTADNPPSLLRQRYEQEVARLSKLAGQRSLSADEAADLGALLVRLGEPARAVQVLLPMQRTHPRHFRLLANLGTAWQLQGDLAQAAAALEQAVRLAPGKYVPAEQLHLRLVRLRQRERPGGSRLDDLFGIRYIGPSGKYEPGLLDPAEAKKLPPAAIALVQQLGLWLPSDSRLLWQMGELANACGDVSTAAAILEGCISEFGLRDAMLAEHRKLLQAKAGELANQKPDQAGKHEQHSLTFRPRSSRPLVSKFNLTNLPPINPKGLNVLAWEVIGETTVDRKSRPTFPAYLRELDGKEVEMSGYMQPLADNTDLGVFMLVEHPVGCWYCEMPDLIGIVLVELPEGKAGKYTRDRIKVRGRLLLNADDPETFFYTIRDAQQEQ